MPKPKDQTPKRLCPGGLSYGRRRDDHQLGKVEDVLCYRCHKRMGCSTCCERAPDLICTMCHDWATEEAIKEHGPMVRPENRNDAMKIVQMTYSGKVSQQEAGLLFDSLWNLS